MSDLEIANAILKRMFKTPPITDRERQWFKVVEMRPKAQPEPIEVDGRIYVSHDIGYMEAAPRIRLHVRTHCLPDRVRDDQPVTDGLNKGL